jgi:hypothetical protein
MPDDQLVLHCAPTLAGIKTGNLFSYFFDDKECLIREIQQVNKVLVPKGLCLLPLQLVEGRALLYLYRPKYLKRDLSGQEAGEILREFGYEEKSLGKCLRRLVNRLYKNEGFPHEIGLFLSYPPEDVRGFIENKADSCKLVGYWKVYGDERKARCLFNKYRKCTELYCKARNKGAKLKELAVAV